MKKIKLLVLTLMFSILFISCSSSRLNSPSNGYESKMEQSNSDMLLANKDKSFYKTEIKKRKIIFSALLSLSVDKLDTVNIQIEKIAKKYKGYVNELGTYRTIIRVKSTYLDAAIRDISTLGNLKNKTIRGQDVTEAYLDYKIRLENAEKARKKYLELLAKAENVEAAVKVEKELERLNETIDLLKGKMKRINHLSEFSTITINLNERKKPGLLGYILMGLYHSVKWLFVRN